MSGAIGKSLLLIAGIGLSAACHATRERGDDFPMTVPASIPEHVFDRPYATDAALKYYPHLIAVQFKQDASAAARARAIREIRGKLVGGIPTPAAEGAYVIEIEADSTSAALFKAIAALEKNAAVHDAAPLLAAGVD